MLGKYWNYMTVAEVGLPSLMNSDTQKDKGMNKAVNQSPFTDNSSAW